MKIATRKSELATYQANLTKSLLEENGIKCEFHFLDTSGDRNQHPLYVGKGIFIKELQMELLDANADIAVHSLKDLPVIGQPSLALCALLQRAAKEDVFILSPKVMQESGINQISEEKRALLSFEELKNFLYKSDYFQNAPIGTSSLRRAAQVKHYLGHHLNCQNLRGNINSRLRRVQNNEFSAIILAKAGLDRIHLYDPAYMFVLDPTVFVPSAGQGIIAVEALYSSAGNAQSVVVRECKKITDMSACIEAGLERTILYLLGSDCNTPVGVCLIKNILYVSTEIEGNFLTTEIEIFSDEMSFVKNLFEKSFIYQDFFENLYKSKVAARLNKCLIRKNFNVEEKNNF